MVDRNQLLAAFRETAATGSLHPWTLPYGDMVTRPGRIVARFLRLEIDQSMSEDPVFGVSLLRALPLRAFAVASTNGPNAPELVCPHHRIAFVPYKSNPRLGDLFIEQRFSADLTHEPEVDVLLSWFVRTLGEHLRLRGFVLGLTESVDYDGSLPHVHSSSSATAWEDLEALVFGRLRPSHGPVENLNYA